MRIYGHYALTDSDETRCYRHTIHKFDITAQDGKDKWTAYTFTKNVYDIYVPIHIQRIRAIIDQLPLPEAFNVEPWSELPGAEIIEQLDSQSTHSYSQESNSKLSSSQTSRSIFKRPKRK